jgi:membrane protein required for colicin V production
LNIIDYIFLFFIIIGFILGFKDGLVRKVIGLFGLILALVLTFYFYESVGVLIQPLLNNELQLAEIAGGILIFLLTMLGASVLKRIVHPLDKVNQFLNQIMGGVTGSLQMLFYISAVLIFFNIFNLPGKSDRESSITYKKISKVVPVTIDLIVGSQYETTKFFEEYIKGKDKFPFQLDVDSLKTKVIDSLNTND